jgi:hypothetical protein
VSLEDLASKYLKKLRALSAEEDVVLARPTLPERIRDVLNRAGYYWEIPGEAYRNQRFGWQEETREAAEKTRSQRPSHNGTLGVLPAPGKRLDEDECLLLVEVNYQWLVLSEIGLHGRTGGQKLLRGESIYFVTNEAEDWAIYELALQRMVERNEVDVKWGVPAARRARPDAPSVVIRAKVIEPGLPR